MSVGKGYRTNHVLAENNYLLASSRKVKIDNDLDQEEAWNYGFSSSFYIPVFGKTLNVNTEYYYTDFRRQMIIDLDTDPTLYILLTWKGSLILILFKPRQLILF